MPIIDLFSKRQKRLRGETPEVYVYDEIPRPLRVQIIQIVGDALGCGDRYNDDAYESCQIVHQILCREYGVFRLADNQRADWECIQHHILECEHAEHVMDAVEICLDVIDKMMRRRGGYAFQNSRITRDEAISELNERFKEHGVGYEFNSGKIIRIDSQYIHSEVVIPTLRFLSDPAFQGANDEFRKAHEHYRHGRYKESLNDCLKSFESTLKTICSQKGWAYKETDTAQKLIDVCMAKGLFAPFMQSQLGSLRSLLESGVPTIRNKQGGHGQGTSVTQVTAATSTYALHLTASNLLFFIQSAQTIQSTPTM